MWNNAKIQITKGRNKVLDAHGGGMNKQFLKKISPLGGIETFGQNIYNAKHQSGVMFLTPGVVLYIWKMCTV